MTKQVIAVIGGTGTQGGGVVDALLAAGTYTVRVASRNPVSDSAKKLSTRSVEVVKADLLDPSHLRAAFEGAYGAFLVTNFWDPAVVRFARDFREGTHVCPTFDDAVTRHRILHAIDSAAETGQRQTLG